MLSIYHSPEALLQTYVFYENFAAGYILFELIRAGCEARKAPQDYKYDLQNES